MRTLVLTVLVAVGCAALPGAAAARPARILILGDSITEGIGLERPQTQGLAAQTARFARGQARSVFVPAHGFTGLNTDAARFFDIGPVTSIAYSSGWRMDGGLDSKLRLNPAGSSPLGLSATPRATTSWLRFAARGPGVQVLYSAARRGIVHLRVDGGPRKTVRLARTDGATFTVPLRTDTHRVTLAGWSRGARFGGYVQTTWKSAMVFGVGRVGLRMANGITADERAGVVALEPDVTVVALGTNDVLARESLARYRAGLRRRAALAHRTGACVVLAPADLSFPAARVARYAAAGRAESRRAGCRWSTAFARTFARGHADVAAGLLHTDGIHPTPLGAARLGKNLAHDLKL